MENFIFCAVQECHSKVTLLRKWNPKTELLVTYRIYLPGNYCTQTVRTKVNHSSTFWQLSHLQDFSGACNVIGCVESARKKRKWSHVTSKRLLLLQHCSKIKSFWFCSSIVATNFSMISTQYLQHIFCSKVKYFDRFWIVFIYLFDQVSHILYEN